MVKKENESVLTDAGGLQAEIALLEARQSKCERQARELLEQEFSGQNFAQEIFALKREKLELKTQILFYNKALSRLQFEQ